MEEPRLRIAVLSAHSCPVGDLGARDTGGMSVYIRELARELGKQGHTVDLYTRVHDPNDPRVEGLAEGVRLIHLRAGRETRIDKMDVYFTLPEFAFNLERFWRENDLSYDIVFSHYWLSALVAKYLHRKWGIPYITMYHTLGAVKNALNIGEGEPALRIVSERDTVEDCQRVIVATDKEKQDLIRYYGVIPEKVGVVPCGVNMELFRPVDKKDARRELDLADEKVLLFVGRIDPLKGIEQLIKAVRLLGNNGDLRLIVVGGDENSRAELEELQQLAAGLGIKDKVTFQGLVRQEKLPYYYSAADVCVVPSYYESFGLVALESLACGTPVVAADVGDLTHIIRPGETGYVAADNSPEKLAAGISSVLSMTPGALAQAIRASVSRYDWSEITASVAGEMRSVLNERVASIA